MKKVLQYLRRDLGILSENILHLEIKNEEKIPFEIFWALNIGEESSKNVIIQKLKKIIEDINEMDNIELSSRQFFLDFLLIANLAKTVVQKSKYNELDFIFDKSLWSKIKHKINMQVLSLLIGIASTIYSFFFI